MDSCVQGSDEIPRGSSVDVERVGTLDSQPVAHPVNSSFLGNGLYPLALTGVYPRGMLGEIGRGQHMAYRVASV